MLRTSELLSALAFRASVNDNKVHSDRGSSAPPLEEFTDPQTGEVLLRPRGIKNREMPYSARDLLERVGTTFPIRYYQSRSLFDTGDRPADNHYGLSK